MQSSKARKQARLAQPLGGSSMPASRSLMAPPPPTGLNDKGQEECLGVGAVCKEFFREARPAAACCTAAPGEQGLRTVRRMRSNSSSSSSSLKDSKRHFNFSIKLPDRTVHRTVLHRVDSLKFGKEG
eukprot:1161193-Pelagomonas_calceolata.AAC.4